MRVNVLQKAIMSLIKEQTTNPENTFLQTVKPVEFISMSQGERGVVKCADGITATHYTVKTRHNAKKYENNIAIWDFIVYSNGDCGIYFDGLSYMQW